MEGLTEVISINRPLPVFRNSERFPVILAWVRVLCTILKNRKRNDLVGVLFIKMMLILVREFVKNYRNG